MLKFHLVPNLNGIAQKRKIEIREMLISFIKIIIANVLSAEILAVVFNWL